MTWPHYGSSHRLAVAGQHAAVATAHPLASLAGLRMLLEGGNAVDAAVAAAAALSVVEPFSSGAGGCGYMTIALPDENLPVVLDFMGLAPAAATLDRFTAPGSKDYGIRSPLVPGAVGGWLAALERFGRLDRSAVLAPAIDYAENGFVVTLYGHRFMGGIRDTLRKWPTTMAAYYPGGEPPPAGAILRQPDQARTLRQIAEGGMEAFYLGPIAKEIARFSQANGGLLTEEDLAEYRPTWQEPISTTYHGYTIYCPPPPCSGMQYLLTLNILEGIDVAAMGQNSADAIHYLAEASKLAKADRTIYASDPDAPMKTLLSQDYAARQRDLIEPRRANPSGSERYTARTALDTTRPGSVASAIRESTTHLVTSDAEGRSVACTQSLGGAGVGFGSGIVYGTTGLALNNLLHWFDDEPTSPNVVAPGKKVEMCMAPSQVWRDGRPFLLLGTPGSWGILQTTPQLLSNVLDHRFGVQAAIEAPRFRTTTGYELAIEGRVPGAVLDELRRRGHQVEVLDPWTKFVGGAQGILIDPDTGTFWGGADPRRDGYALAF